MRRSARDWSPVHAVAAVAALALLARVVALGQRVAHQDEARVAHWILHYMDVGAWQYRAIIHGPFLPHVNGVVFSWLGASDFTMRLVVAVAGALLPLTALLFRSRLRDDEVVATAVLLAASPVLLYYSRFMRNDVVLAALALATVGFLVRAMDTGRRRHLYAAGAAFGLALTTKENALLYPVCWLGALALLLDARLVTARHRDDHWLTELAGTLRDAGARVRPWLGHCALAALLGAAVTVAFYAPKPELYRALGDPALLPDVVRVATLGTWGEFLELWGDTGMQEHSYVKFLGQYLYLVAVGAPLLLAFGVVGFFADRYGRDTHRPLVAFCAFWGGFSLLGYPVVTDIMAAWATVHAVVPLAVPGGVGLALLARKTRSALAADRRAPAAAGLAVLLVSAGLVGAIAADTSYLRPQHRDNPLAQYAQPAGDMKPTLAKIERVSRTNDGVDVTFYGDEFYAPDDYTTDLALDIDDYADPNDDSGGYPGWFSRLPLPWYLERYGANVTSTKDPGRLAENPPPVVVTLAGEEHDVRHHLDGYARYEHQGYLWGRPVVFYVRE